MPSGPGRSIDLPGPFSLAHVQESVVHVNWDEASEFCRWLSENEQAHQWIPTNWFYRLPKDAEWSIAVGLTNEIGDSPEDKARTAVPSFVWGGWVAATR